MLRAILKMKQKLDNGLVTESFSTLEFQSKELEANLRIGGCSETSYLFCELLGVEVVE